MTTVRQMFEDIDRKILRDLELSDWYLIGRREGFKRGFFTASLIAACIAGAVWCFR